MALSVDPRPLPVPLPGGRDGAHVRLHPLNTAMLQQPPQLLRRPGGPLPELRSYLLTRRSRWIEVPVPAFLVEHHHRGFAGDAARPPEDRVVQVDVPEDQDAASPEPAEQLRQPGM